MANRSRLQLCSIRDLSDSRVLRAVGVRGPRILRPRMLRVAAAQFLPHLRVGAIPEAAQIARDLHRPAVRREQREQHRLAARADARRLREAEQLLQLHRRRHRPVSSYSSGAWRPLGTRSVSGASRSRARSTSAGRRARECDSSSAPHAVGGGPHDARSRSTSWPANAGGAAGGRRRRADPRAATRRRAVPQRSRDRRRRMLGEHERVVALDATRLTVPVAASKRCTTSVEVGVSHSRSTRLAMRMRGSLSGRPVCGPRLRVAPVHGTPFWAAVAA